MGQPWMLLGGHLAIGVDRLLRSKLPLWSAQVYGNLNESRKLRDDETRNEKRYQIGSNAVPYLLRIVRNQVPASERPATPKADTYLLSGFPAETESDWRLALACPHAW